MANDSVEILLVNVGKMIVGAFGFVGNGLVCATICYTKELHNVTNLFILSLAVADALTSICSTMKVFATRVEFAWNGTGCTPELGFLHDSKWAHYFFQSSFFAHSVLCLGLILIERYIGIIKPLHYASFFSRTKIVLMLVIAWVTPFAVELPRLIYTVVSYRQAGCIDNDHANITAIFSIMSIILFAVPASIMIWIYIQILANLKQGAKNLREIGIKGSAEQLLQAHKKVTSSLIIITLAFFLLVFPMRIYKVLREIDVDRENFFIVYNCFLLLALVNSAINPVLYGFKYKQLRAAFKAMVCQWLNHFTCREKQVQKVKSVS